MLFRIPRRFAIIGKHRVADYVYFSTISQVINKRWLVTSGRIYRPNDHVQILQDTRRGPIYITSLERATVRTPGYLPRVDVSPYLRRVRGFRFILFLNEYNT